MFQFKSSGSNRGLTKSAAAINQLENSIKTTLEHNSNTVIEEDESHFNGLTTRNVEQSP